VAFARRISLWRSPAASACGVRPQHQSAALTGPHAGLYRPPFRTQALPRRAPSMFSVKLALSFSSDSTALLRCMN
jgi:hypothetical protein